ncbi:MAG TPA: PEGA domain-containing protein [Candidatus Polarisedimenticolaceae bacterium]|nr:PEGA domain-containing protein [Candidatus Polarisedimenticolaceae bacterium]
MSRPVQIEAAGVRRTVGPEAFPLSCGATECDLALDVVGAGGPVAWLGQTDGELFVEVARDDVPISCNGVPVTSSQWLRDGDRLRVGNSVIRLSAAGGELGLVVETTEDDVTEPPALLPAEFVGSDAESDRTIRPIAYRPGATGDRAPAVRRRGRAAWAAWIAVALAAGAAWFVFATRSVEIRVEPPPERLRLSGTPPVIRLAGRYLVRPGDHRVVAEKPGYEPLDVTIEVTGESNQTFEFRLSPLPDLVAITTGGVDGARVWVDGIEIGVTPLSPFPLAAGEHELRVEAERHAAHLQPLRVDGGGDSVPVEVQLVPRFATVRFRSEPAGATVQVDGVVIGETPLTADVDEGRRRVRFLLTGHQPFDDTLRIDAGAAIDLPLVRLAPAQAALALDSQPPGAIVTLDGDYAGETPIELAIEPTRASRIGLSKAGYETAWRTLSLRSGERAAIEVDLVPRYGEVAVRAVPPDAELWVDGTARGRADQTLRLVAVPQRIEIRKPGFLDFRTEVTPRPDFPQVVHAILKTEEQIAAERRPPRIRTSEGQELLLIEGGRFRMGAPRREPGRRANETERDVELTRPFYLSTTEISNRDFRRFRAEHLSGQVGGHNLEIDNHPVVRVSWNDAALFCNWLSERDSLDPFYEAAGGRVVAVVPTTNGYRLPTEAEWAWAARFDADGRERKYPWGDALPIPAAAGNFADRSAAGMLSTTLDAYDDGYPATAPVDGFAPDVRGLFQVGGNVAEWIHDGYTVNSPAAEPVVDPIGPDAGELHVIRGSSWMDATISELRLTFRDYGTGGRPDLGFRIARYAD